MKKQDLLERIVDDKRILSLILLISLTCSSAFSLFVLDGLPHIQDSVNYLYQARTFAEGRIRNPPLTQEFYLSYQFILADNTQTVGSFPPGWPAILAVGVLFNIPWMINPILHAINLLLIFKVGELSYDKRVGFASMVFASLSPFMMFMSASFMSHTAMLFFLLLLAYCCLKFRSVGGDTYAFASGAFWGVAILTRPLTGALLGTLLWVYFMFFWGKGKTDFGGLFHSLIALSIVVILLFVYNIIITGSPASFPSDMYFQSELPKRPDCNRLGFGLGRGCDTVRGHNLDVAVSHLRLNLSSLNKELFGWPLSSFLFIPFGLLHNRFWRRNLVFLLFAGFLIAGHMLYWNVGACFGPRFYFEATPFLIFVSVTGVFWLDGKLRMLSCSLGKLVVPVFLIVLFGFSGLIHVPGKIVEYGDDYWLDHAGVSTPHYSNLKILKETYPTPIIVFIPLDIWGSGFLLNDVSVTDDVVFANLGSSDVKPNTLYASTARVFHKVYYPESQCFFYFILSDGNFELIDCDKM